jgi:radical SAM protein with 4Fe4S-binding SPASM domain
MQIDTLSLSSLYAHDGLDADAVASIDTLSTDQLQTVAHELKGAKDVLDNSSTKLSFQPRLVQLAAGQSEEAGLSSRMTRICLQPWRQYTIGADGQVFPCCVCHQDNVGHIQDGSASLLNGEAITTFRENLLLGDLPDVCRHCSNAPLGKCEELVNEVVKEVAISAIRSGHITL